MITISTREVTIFEIVVAALLIMFGAINVGIFFHLKKNFSIKYELLRDKNFRGRKWLQKIIQILYRMQLLIPVILMVILFLELVVRDVKSGFTLLPNGFLLVSLIYLTNANTFFYKVGAILFLLVASQLLTLYLTEQSKQVLYSASSSIYFSLNGILVSMSIFANQSIYWDLSQAISLISSEVMRVNQDWLQKIPKIMNGGLYGWFNKRNKSSLNNMYASQTHIALNAQQINTNTQVVKDQLQKQNKQQKCCYQCDFLNRNVWPLIFYFLSLVVLGIYCFQDWWFSNGFIGTISGGAILTFDFAVFVLSSLSEKTRTPFSVMFIIFMIRLFLFVFGNSYWFLGYCILYILIGTFVAYLIIQKRYPKIKQKQTQIVYVNALKTPEFIFILITVQLLIMIVALYFTDNKDIKAENFLINGQQFEFWSVGVISIFITFIFALYLASNRILYRSVNKIRDNLFTQYHMSVLVTFSAIVALGIYTFLKYNSSLSLTLCIFIPLILMTIVQMQVCWQKNNYRILVDLEQYNKKQQRKKEIQKNNRQIMSRFINDKKILQQLQQHSKRKLPPIKRKSQLQIYPDQSSKIMNRRHRRRQQKDQQKDIKNIKNIEFPERLKYLTYNDKRLLLLLLAFVILNVGMILTTFFWCKNNVGTYIAVSIVSYITQVPYIRSTKTLHQLKVMQIITIVCGYLLSFIFWSVYWYQIGGGLAWSVVFILILSYLLVQILRYKKNQKKLYIMLIIQIILLMIYDVITIYFNFNNIFYMVTVCAVMFYYLLALVFYFVWQLYQRSPPKSVYISFITIILVTLVAIIVAAFFVNQISVMATFSIATLIPLGSVIVFGWIQFYYRYKKRYENIVVYSAYGLPSMRFQSQKQVFKKDEFYLYLYFIALMGLIVYAQIIFFFFESNINAGIYVLCFFQITTFLTLILMIMKNYYEIGKNKSEITQTIIQETFKLLTQKYMSTIDDDINTGKKKDQLQEKERIIEQNPQHPEIDNICDEIVHLHDTIVKDQQEQQVFLFFWTALIQFRILSHRKQMMNTLLNSVRQNQQQFQNVGIAFDLKDQINNIQIRYEKLQNQINSLELRKKLLFDKIMNDHKQKVKEQQKQAEDLSNKQNDMIKTRQIQLERLLKQQQPQKKNGYTMSDLDKQKIQDFKNLVNSIPKNQLYQDPDFPANGSSLGPKVIDRVQGWSRPSQKCEVIKENINVKDIKQGYVGDCYLISTLGVLGENKIKKAMGLPFTNQKDQKVKSKWPCYGQKGAFMVRFKKFKQNIFIVIDSLFPVNSEGDWVCGRCEDPLQIWVNIIQKAYAKMYGSYTNIFGGKAHLVMSEFTGGFPTQISLKQYSKNPNALYNKLQLYYDNKYIMAAGTPAGSDKSYSTLGIAKGHAYSIIKVKSVDDHKLIQLKNPQGSRSMQWQGEFGDRSAKMDKRMKQLLQFTVQDDGIFWMPVLDFVRQFKSLYICREFDQTNWLKIDIPSSWSVQKNNSYGGQKNRKIERNPQYGITVNKKCTLFVSLSQQNDDAGKTFHGQNTIGFRLQRNNGKRIYYKDLSPQLLCNPAITPAKTITITNEYQLQQSTYPCVYTLMVYCQQVGDQGPYNLQIYCNDKSFSVIKDDVFDKLPTT